MGALLVGDVSAFAVTPPEVLTVGETMAMLAPARAEPLTEAVEFRVDAGGAESNVAGHLAALGIQARWHSRLGDDAVGDRVLRQLASRGIDVSTVVRDETRPTGLYVKDPGSAVRYYRAGSAASAFGVDDAAGADLAGIRLLHVSGITAALSVAAAAFLNALITRARDDGVTVSFDVNHRPALWSASAAAQPYQVLPLP